MPRASKPRRGKKGNANDDDDPNHDASNNNNNNPVVRNRQLPEAVRNRQRAVAEREAARLARPERRPTATLGHADRKKSAVTSTPFGILNSRRKRKADDDDDSEMAWCGPFSVARQMLAARDQAKRQREAEQLLEDEDDPNQSRMKHPLDAAMAQVEEEKQQQAHPSLLWKSRATISSSNSNSSVMVTPDAKSQTKKRGSRLPPGPPAEEQHNRVPSLYKMCVDFVVTNFEHVESLGYGVDHDIRTSIAQTLASQNRLDAAALEALVTKGDAMEALELIDCADIPQESLVAALQKCCYPGDTTTSSTLKYLILDQAGRCFGPKAVTALAGPSALLAQQRVVVPLFALHIGGAYLLTDVDAARLITAMAQTLQSLAWKACPLLGLEMCRSIPAMYGSGSSNTLLEFSLEDMALDRESWNALIGMNSVATAKKSSNTSWQRNLKSLTLRRVGGLQDKVVISLLQGAPDLEHVDLSDNHELTDACLSPLRRTSESHGHSPSSLRSLALYNLKNISNLGLETLFTQDLMGMGPPPQLKRLNLNHMDVDAVTDEVMELILQSACRKPVTSAGAATGRSSVSAVVADTVAHSGLSMLGGMVKVEVQGAAITDNTLEQLAATSANTIEHLDVSFCPHISDKGLGYLVDSVGNQLENVQIWGCAQVTEEFWNGHARVIEGGRKSITNSNDVAPVVPLQITGAWMKRSGIASIRS